MENNLKNLIIVESPTKARTIENFLGKDYTVIASKGHIRDLPKSSFGIKVEDQVFIPEYRVGRDHAKIVKEIKTLAKKSDRVYIATDEDREGEAIGFHIATAIGEDPAEIPRIVFHEITKTAINHSLENPRKIDLDSVNAQQARRLLDRIVGYRLSPLIASKIQKGLSAGRVQSSSLKIVVDKEREIKAFIPVEYWSLDALFEKNIESVMVEFEGKKIDKMTISAGDIAKNAKEIIEKESFIVGSLEKKQRKTSSNPPFMTSTIQQTASSVIGFSPRKTMMVAQTLYEGVKTDNGVTGVITYMRTDSLNVAAEAIEGAREHILSSYGDKYLPKEAKYYKSKSKGAQEAHEAIRPTILSFTPQIAKSFLKPDELKPYTLIYNRFIASQMTDALFESQSIIFESKSSKFKASGRKLVFDGFYRVLGSSDKDKLLPTLEKGKEVELSELKANQHFTEPPSRYSEASLIKKLESLEIGRPSTYAPTISLLTSRSYIEIEKKQLIPTENAFKVIELLEKHFAKIVDSSFTSAMEEDLDEIAEGKKDWQKVLWEFYDPFIKEIEDGKKNIKSQKIAIPTGEKCPKCGEELLKRKGRYGEFIACSGFPKCKYTQNVDGEGNVTEKKVLPILPDVPCPECGSGIVERKSRRGKFYGCSAYPKCKFISTYTPTTKKCEADGCGYIMASRTLRKKEIFECIKCKNRVDA
ncbi:MAG TPA: type I DNA topoisomerase [Campylobacterales bacterium]|nr:type I DNA topoisomerase [Campylobacterales bacterium]